jgi:hypothetical protein
MQQVLREGCLSLVAAICGSPRACRCHVPGCCCDEAALWTLKLLRREICCKSSLAAHHPLSGGGSVNASWVVTLQLLSGMAACGWAWPSSPNSCCRPVSEHCTLTCVQNRVAVLQSLSGTGSLRLGAAFIAKLLPAVLSMH